MPNTVRLHRVLTAKPEKVYRAFIEPDAMARWLPPNGFTGRVHHLDAKVGGTFRMSFTNFTTGKSHAFGGEYQELKPGERLRYTDRFDDPNLPGEMLVTVDLKPVMVGTDITIVQEGIPDAIPVEFCYLGWQESLQGLARLVEPDIQNGADIGDGGETRAVNSHGDFIWYELLTTNADAAQAFYADIFGWRARDSGQPGMDYRLLTASAGDVAGIMQINDEMKAGGARPVWLGYIAVDDVDASMARIAKAGGKAQMPAMDVPNVGRLAMVTDPQGAPFYIMRDTSGQTSLAFAYDTPRLGHCAWNELVTSDRAAAMAFYGEHFGWRKDGEMDMGPLGAYEFLRRAGAPGVFAGVMTKSEQMPASSWTHYFRVGDIDAAIARTVGGGGTVVHGPQEIPGGEFAVNAIDPQGAPFAFVGPRTSDAAKAA
jgi:hypothetical protein